MKKISIIIPVFNCEQYLRECLNCVLAQTLKDIEVICIDDGSTDTTLAILNKYAKRDARIQVLTQENTGAALARNRGIKIAQGEFLAFIDADDLYPKADTLEKLYKNAKEQGVLICGGSFSEFRTGTKVIVSQWDDPNLSGYTFHSPGIINYSDYQFDYGWVRFIYNREFIVRNTLEQPNYRYFEDPPFFVRAMTAAERFYAIPDTTYLYRLPEKGLHGPSTTNRALDAFEGIEHNIRFAYQMGFETLLKLSVWRLCQISRFVEKNDFSVIKRQIELLALLESFPEADLITPPYVETLQWTLIDEKNALVDEIEALNNSKTFRFASFLARCSRKIRRLP